MTTATTQEQPNFLYVEPQLFVADMVRSLAYYVEQLGFSVTFEHGSPTFYAQVARGDVRLNLRHVDWPALDHSTDGDLLSASIIVRNARQLLEELRSRGAAIHQPLKQEAWRPEGQGAFIVADPDGNLLLFAGATT
jgi:catechol 2,3-dioxygenase-like lactoylglutathione lyase family enzyme